MSTGDAPGGREHLVTEAFVALANSLVGPFDEVELLNGLTTDCTRLLDVAAAGLLLADRNGVLHVVAASSERTRSLELFQLQRDEGPCLDCFRSGRPTNVDDLSLEVDRWPEFVPAAIEAGFASVHAIPMRLLDDVLGAVGLFGTSTGSLNEEDLDLAQALAHVAAVAIGVGAGERKTSVADQLHAVLKHRVLVEQAKGIIAQQGGLEMDEAFTKLRQYAQTQDQRLTEVARALVSRQLSPQLLLRPTAGDRASG
jgi:transcriptional regulator with GAF, ATPase, and Fis domain